MDSYLNSVFEVLLSLYAKSFFFFLESSQSICVKNNSKTLLISLLRSAEGMALKASLVGANTV